ncbi:MAG: hypothetical protein V1800_10665 [Candidatus Latescibacterota bacterium]
MKRERIWLKGTVIAGCLLLSGVHAQAQPPTWWSYYLGSGKADWGRTETEAHSGKYSAFMRGAAYGETGQDIHVGLMAGKSEGYTGPEGYPILPGTAHSFSFWMKGDFSRIGVFALCWRTEEAAGSDRVWVPLDGTDVLTSPLEVQQFTMSQDLVPTDAWTEHTGTFTPPADAKKFVLIFMASGAGGSENLGTIFVDEVVVDAGQGNLIQNPGAEDPPDLSGTVIWDTHRTYTHFFLNFEALADRELWTQVPYGMTDYVFAGDAVIENEYMWLFLHSGQQSGPILYAKIDGQPSVHNALYKIFYSGGPHYGRAPRENVILVNQPGEVIVKNTASVGSSYPVITTYRLQKEQHALEVEPIQVHDMGYHGEARVLLVPDYKDGNDWVADSAYGDWASYPVSPEGSGMVIDLQMLNGQFMWTMAYASWEKTKPFFDFVTEGRLDQWPPWKEGPLQRYFENRVFSALYGSFNEEKIVVGVINSPGSWHPEIVGTPLADGLVAGRPVSAGETVVTQWTVPYAGQWRMTARMEGGNYYSQQVAASVGQALSFICPVAGNLEYLILYLYDRTAQTPARVGTPMDIYRDTILKTGIEDGGAGHSLGETPGTPGAFALFPNQPNPFNSETLLRFEVPRSEHVHLAVHNLLGQPVRTLVDQERHTGTHAVRWDGKDEAGRGGGERRVCGAP